MTNLLGIDYGLKKVGLALSSGQLSEPFTVIRYNNLNSLISQISIVCQKEKVEKIIVGISEGEMALKTREFIKNLKEKISIPIEEFDETLSTQEAQRLSIESGIKRSKRKNLEDAMAASIMLQNYLDTN